MVTVTRKASFSAAHRLFNPAWSEERNARVFGKCNNPHGHGHNYTLEVSVAGEVGADTGMVIDLKELAEIVEREIIDRVDHKHLNHDVDFLAGVIPTAENIALAFWRILAPKIHSGTLVGLRLHESEHNVVEVRGDPASRGNEAG